MTFIGALCCLCAAAGVQGREEARISFEESVAVYSREIFPAITNLVRCGDYRVLVVYGNGTDMLFLDRLVPTLNESTYATEDGMSFIEFNTYEEAIQIKDVSCKVLAPAKVRITGRAYSAHSEKNFRFTLVVDVAKRTHTYEDTQPK